MCPARRRGGGGAGLEPRQARRGQSATWPSSGAVSRRAASRRSRRPRSCASGSPRPNRWSRPSVSPHRSPAGRGRGPRQPPAPGGGDRRQLDPWRRPGRTSSPRPCAPCRPRCSSATSGWAGKVVELALTLPGGKLLPIDSKWVSSAALEQLAEPGLGRTAACPAHGPGGARGGAQGA